MAKRSHGVMLTDVRTSQQLRPERGNQLLDQVLFTYQFNLEHIKHLVADLSEDLTTQQPHGLLNHPRWTIGHLAFGSNYAAGFLGLQSTVKPAWAELLAELAIQHKRVAAAIREAEPSLFKEECTDELLRDHFPTIGNFLGYIMTAHEGDHIGQLACWRRAMTLPPAEF